MLAGNASVYEEEGYILYIETEKLIITTATYRENSSAEKSNASMEDEEDNICVELLKKP